MEEILKQSLKKCLKHSKNVIITPMLLNDAKVINSAIHSRLKH